ncbi:hypothetical protein BHC54_04535 [Snodgrassella alvi]|uniref:Uncharacterized protein n=1 Tax=Snodgrassella alvi TaxID=1196083 RepID=A0A2N9X7N0_9NEIS|nr:hypothetical protein BHC54_04535 [Snodgrassella alvi]
MARNSIKELILVHKKKKRIAVKTNIAIESGLISKPDQIIRYFPPYQDEKSRMTDRIRPTDNVFKEGDGFISE